MSIEFDAPPLTRRERREREQLLIAQGATPEEAAELAGQTGVIAISRGSATQAPVAEPVVAEPVVAEPVAVEAPVVELPSSEAPAVVRVGGRRAIREQSITSSGPVFIPAAAPVPSDVEADAPEADAPEPTASEPATIETAEPRAEADVQVVEVVEQLFSSEPSAVLDPTTIPPEPGTETGPIHWTDALSLPANFDPTDPASMPDLPSFGSDTNTIVLDSVPDVTTLPAVTGEIELVMTGSILLPTELTQTGALPDLLDAEHVELNDDISDELPLSSLAPKSASAAVNASAETPSMVSEPVKPPLSRATVIALTAGGAAGVVLIALGLGALLHLF